MTKNDRTKFGMLMKALNETFGNSIPTKEKMEVYFRALSDLSIEQIDVAVINLLNSRTITTTFPVPAEIRAAIGVDAKSFALIALNKAERAVELHGSYCAVVFDDPVIHMVIRTMGGWAKFCCPAVYGDEQDWQWKQKEFISLYETFSKNPRADCPRILVGLGDTSYTRDGELILIAPEYIGDKLKAMAWSSVKKSLPAPDETSKRDVGGMVALIVGKKPTEQ
jgi:hypothetical protein